MQARITGPALNTADSQAAGQVQPSAAAYTADQRFHACCAVAYRFLAIHTCIRDTDLHQQASYQGCQFRFFCLLICVLLF